MSDIDPLDAKILLALDDQPDASMLHLAHTLGISRNTVQARLRRIGEEALLLGPSQRVPPRSLGYGLTAFISLTISQQEGSSIEPGLSAIPEVTEIHETTGDADLLIRVVAKDTADLNRVIKLVHGVANVIRSSTSISLAETMPRRTRALLELRAAGR